MRKSISKLATASLLTLSSYSVSASSLPDGLSGFKLGMNPEQARAHVDKLLNGKNPNYVCEDDLELHPTAFKCVADLLGVSYFGMPVRGVTIAFVNKKAELLRLTMDAYSPSERSKSLDGVMKGLKPFLPSDGIFADGSWFAPVEAESPLHLMYGSDYVWQLLQASKEKEESKRSAQP